MHATISHTVLVVALLHAPTVVSYGGGRKPISPGMVVLIVLMGVAAFIFCVSVGLWGRRRNR